ncbi:dimethyl sulfoxide reductase anchor subunit [Salipaludibacillus sp. CUR1]|uniref:dimethyl sulfoxide reductase anchor subunit family protein n=1 Tax=Salipaludibacillus sp. CUR1 TaxID=2820003 RepID=UPI001E5266F0|nr:DmsC/YnfH family molybdoenzyme membrane anchor subunit [Salipaludibacillus sp. CUR1]MCE7792931.1 dimethyl sulfoxide reductase anchor subunit [Salipaludibacillus sp. CUR1]
MFSQEWPLIFFTLFGQLAVGTFIVLMAARFVLKRNGITDLRWLNPSLLALTVLMAVAIVMSMFHLGSISNAFYALSNAGSSWLAREILLAGVFLALLVATYAISYTQKSIDVISWVTAAAGIATVYAMASVYVTTIIPAWMHVNTYLAYFGTTVIYGVVGAGLCFMVFGRKEFFTSHYVSFMKKAGFVAAGAIIVQLIVLPVYLTSLAGGAPAAQMSLNLLFENHAWTMLLRWLLTIAGGGLLIYSFYRYADRLTKHIPAFIYVAVALVLIGEFTGRYLFYISGIPMNIG